jgi:hypothetical protein
LCIGTPITALGIQEGDRLILPITEHHFYFCTCSFPLEQPIFFQNGKFTNGKSYLLAFCKILVL